MSENIILALISSFGLIAVAYFQNKKSDNLKGLLSMLKSTLMDLQNDVSILNAAKEKDQKEHNFRMEFKSDIAKNASIKVNGSELLKGDTGIESALINYFNDIPEYAFSFFYSDMRKDQSIAKEDFKNMLASKLNSLMYSFIFALQSAVKIEKSHLHGKNIQMVLFTEYLAETIPDEGFNCFQLNARLIDKLVDNGIDEQKLKSIFINYTAAFIEQFRKSYKLFLELKNYDDEIEKILD